MTTPAPSDNPPTREVEMKLLPCPFCGGAAEPEHLEHGPWSAGCSNEECIGWQSTTTFARKCEAIAAWNTRSPQPSRPQGEAALRAMDHAANEWADAFYNAVQWIKNIKSGCSLPDSAIQNVERCAEHCQATWAAAKAFSNPGPQEEEGWRPISEAPRDGTHVLVTGSNGTDLVLVAQWLEESADEGFQGPCWMGYWQGYVRWIAAPTHWQPLPAPPSALSNPQHGEPS